MLRSGALRYFSSIKNGSTPASGNPDYWDGNVAWATPDDLGRLKASRLVSTRRTITTLALIENNLNLLPEGSVLLSTRAPIGHMAINGLPLTFNQGCRGIIPYSSVFAPYLLYLLQSRVAELNACANGTTFVELSRDDLAAVKIEVPSFEVQRRSATFLDEKTAQIDALIEKKQQLLERLAEKRQTIITQAVTKGLNPAAPMKDSGIDWLGQIPAHWQVLPLKRMKKYLTSGSRDWAEYYSDEGDNFLRMTNVTKGGVEIDGTDLRKVKLDGVFEGTRTATRAGDILITITAELGSVAIVSSEFQGSYINQHLALFRCDQEQCDPEFLVNFLWSDVTKTQFVLSGQGGTKQGLGFDQVDSVVVALPPLNEQSQIAKFVKTQHQRINALEGAVRTSQQSLIEYRSALITTAVTGKIEVLQ